MPSSLIVYSYRRCPFAMRVRIALNEKGIAFHIQEEDLNHFSEKLKALHPEVKVPVLVDGEKIIYESAIITEYVNDLAPEHRPLMPSLPGEKADVRLWTYWCNHHLKPAIDRFKYGENRFSNLECVGAEEKVKLHLIKLEETLKTQDWLVGTNFTLAEVNLFPFVRQLFRIQPNPTFLKSFPFITQWVEKISARPSVITALLK